MVTMIAARPSSQQFFKLIHRRTYRHADERRQRPTGGVMCPIAEEITQTMPKWIG